MQDVTIIWEQKRNVLMHLLSISLSPPANFCLKILGGKLKNRINQNKY